MLSNSYRGSDNRTDATGDRPDVVEARSRRLLARLAFWRSGPTVVHECRRCGASLPSPDADCPFGCSATVTTYVIE